MEKPITLRSISSADAGKIADILQSERIKPTYMVPDLSPEAALQMASRIAALSHAENRYVRGIYTNETLVGLLNDVGIEKGVIELGWVVAPEHQGNGYATQAVCDAIADLFSKGYNEVTAGAFAENAASIRVMEKAGMVLQEKTESIEYRGQVHKCIYYTRSKQ